MYLKNKYMNRGLKIEKEIIKVSDKEPISERDTSIGTNNQSRRQKKAN